MVIDNPMGAARTQVKRYWKFLLFASDDVEQSLYIAILGCDSQDSRQLNNSVNREMYKLARELGFRKRHRDEGVNEKGQWWERRILSFEETDKSNDQRYIT